MAAQIGKLFALQAKAAEVTFGVYRDVNTAGAHYGDFGDKIP